jgi:hypothetical protein
MVSDPAIAEVPCARAKSDIKTAIRQTDNGQSELKRLWETIVFELMPLNNLESRAEKYKISVSFKAYTDLAMPGSFEWHK